MSRNFPFGTLVLWSLALVVLSQAVSPQAASAVALRLDRIGSGRLWLVPADGRPTRAYPTIQAAVNAASEGDTVLLSEGVFRGPGNRDVLVTGKNVRIESVDGPANCIIDCEYQGRALHFEGPLVTDETVLQGVTIYRGSFLPVGGGILSIGGSTPVIDNCIVTACTSGSGGGIAYGGAFGRPPVGVIRNTLVSDNHAGGGGGIRGGNIIIERCIVRNNTASSNGGGISAFGSEGVIRNTLLLGNVAENAGGGIYSSGDQRITGCTVVRNSAHSGGGVGFSGCDDALLENSIVWDNSATNFGSQVVHGFGLGGFIENATIRYCNIEGGASGIHVWAPSMPVITDLLDADPMFAEPSRADYSLTPGSPCVDAGRPSFEPDVNEGDLENQPRVHGPSVDLGADELWSGFVLTLVSPGRSGEENEVVATGGPPGALVAFFFGFSTGHWELPFRACPDLALDLDDPIGLGVDVVGPAGIARYSQHVPASLSGATILLQAIALEIGRPSTACQTSNLVAFTYP